MAIVEDGTGVGAGEEDAGLDDEGGGGAGVDDLAGVGVGVGYHEWSAKEIKFDAFSVPGE